jgi:6-pyruvoyltetrahydropterin/6-carboxytetrahydropterin synthase
MHGHKLQGRVTVAGPVDPATGWLIDFGVIDDAWAELFGAFDHHNLNDVPGLENSTCENIAIYVWRALRPQIASCSAGDVWETYDSKCTYRAEDPPAKPAPALKQRS